MSKQVLQRCAWDQFHARNSRGATPSVRQTNRCSETGSHWPIELFLARLTALIGIGIDYSGVASELDVMKIIDRRLYDPIISQLKRAVASGRGAAAALAEARRTKLTKHHPELAQLVEEVRRIH